MYKELGFTKEAGKVDVVWKATKKFMQTHDLPTLSRKARDTVGGIIEPWGFKMPGGTVTTTVKEKLTKPGFGLGIGVGVLGSMGVNALFGSKKRNSPYYPS